MKVFLFFFLYVSSWIQIRFTRIMQFYFSGTPNILFANFSLLVSLLVLVASLVLGEKDKPFVTTFPAGKTERRRREIEKEWEFLSTVGWRENILSIHVFIGAFSDSFFFLFFIIISFYSTSRTFHMPNYILLWRWRFSHLKLHSLSKTILLRAK